MHYFNRVKYLGQIEASLPVRTSFINRSEIFSYHCSADFCACKRNFIRTEFMYPAFCIRVKPIIHSTLCNLAGYKCIQSCFYSMCVFFYNSQVTWKWRSDLISVLTPKGKQFFSTPLSSSCKCKEKQLRVRKSVASIDSSQY